MATTRSRSDILRTACFDVVDMLIDFDGIIISIETAVLNKYRLFLKGLLRVRYNLNVSLLNKCKKNTIR